MTVVVTGATGRQGGAVVRHLLAAGFSVRALSRDPAAVVVPGASLVVADQEDPASLRRAFEGASGVFSVQPYSADDARLGWNVADAASATGVSHLVYSSLVASWRPTGVPSFDSKWEVEQHLAALGIPTTVLRPTTFMDFLYTPGMTRLSHLLDADTRYQLIAVDDIGAVAARVFAAPSRFVGASLVLAGDVLTPVEMAAQLGVPYEQLQVDDPSLRQIFGHPEELTADFAELRALHPDLKNFQSFLKEARRSVA